MNIIALSSWLATFAAIVTVSVGVAVWSAQARDALRRSFLGLSVFIGLWIISNVIYVVAGEPAQFPVALASYFFAIGVAVHLYLFSLRAAGAKQSSWPILIVGYLFGAMSAVPGVIATGVKDGNIITNTWSLAGYGVVLAGLIVGALLVFLNTRKNARYVRRQQLNLVLAGLAAASAIGILFNLILPIIGEYRFVQLGPAGASLFIGAIAYATVRHGLFDVRLAVVRSVAYGLVVITLASLYVGLAYGLTASLRVGSSASSQLVINVSIALLLVFLFQPIRRFFDQLTNSVFYRSEYSVDGFTRELSDAVSTVTDLELLLSRVAQVITRTFKAENVKFVVFDQDKALTIGATKSGMVEAADFDWITRWWRSRDPSPRAVVTRREINFEKDEERLMQLFTRYGAEAMLALTQGGEVTGILLIGERRSGRHSMRDFHVISMVIDELSIAVQNAFSLREVKLLNETLQQRIEAATKELRESNSELIKLDEVKDEFISMASHQLRTPLTSIKGYVDMMLDGDAGEITKTQRRFLTEAFVSSERMVHLINDFLNVSRLQTGRFTIEKQPTDLVRIVRQEIDGLKISAFGYDLEFQIEADDNVPILMLDEAKIRQVVMNFADNALYYSKSGTVVHIKLSVDKGDVVFSVEDTGIGVPQDEQAKLFTKFFRATNARKQRPDGTGIGLFLAKRVVNGHGGEIIFASTEGKGSKFGFRLPIDKLSAAD